jgi:hypothetical protein
MACRTAWRMCRKNLTDFSNFKSKYTEDFIAQNMQAIEDADLLPDVNARYTEPEAVRLEMVKVKDEILFAFKYLQAYIDDAVEADMRQKMYNAAGKSFYDRANQCNWSSVSGLLYAAIPFIQDNKAALMANENMPESFLERFKALKVRFNDLLAEFEDSDAAATDKTSEKVFANNSIYDKVKALLEDGKRMYADNAELSKSFTWSVILSHIHSNKPAGIDGKVVDTDTQKPIAKAQISVLNSHHTAKTNKKGRFAIVPLSAGAYTVLVEAEGFQPVTVSNIVLKTVGVVSIVAQLQPVLTTKAILERVN